MIFSVFFSFLLNIFNIFINLFNINIASCKQKERKSTKRIKRRKCQREKRCIVQ